MNVLQNKFFSFEITVHGGVSIYTQILIGMQRTEKTLLRKSLVINMANKYPGKVAITFFLW